MLLCTYVFTPFRPISVKRSSYRLQCNSSIDKLEADVHVPFKIIYNKRTSTRLFRSHNFLTNQICVIYIRNKSCRSALSAA